MRFVCSDAHTRHSPSLVFDAGDVVASPETPARVDSIASSLREQGLESLPPDACISGVLASVHTRDYLDHLERAHADWIASGGSGPGVVPDTFPRHRGPRKPRQIDARVGWYCLDTGTPIMEHTYHAAVEAAACALTGAELLLAGDGGAYALCRPPGHHAGPDYCSGFCYLNNAAVAAARLLDAFGPGGRVSILDVDYHHGNGTQEIFYGSDRVLFASLHADPGSAYPYYSGYAEEIGTGPGTGLTINTPLPPDTGANAYLGALDRLLEAIAEFAPRALVVSLGVDTYKGDPIGCFRLGEHAFTAVGERISRLAIPTLLVQEGGYDLDAVGRCVRNVLQPFVH